jgi:hypothetical protein
MIIRSGKGSGCESSDQAEREAHVGTRKGLSGWNDVKHRESVDTLWIVECHAIGDAPTPIMPRHAEA